MDKVTGNDFAKAVWVMRNHLIEGRVSGNGRIQSMAQTQTHSGDILRFPQTQPEERTISRFYQFTNRIGATVMATPKDDNAIRINPTVAALLISLLTLLGSLVYFVYQFGQTSQQLSEAVKKIEKLEQSREADMLERQKLNEKVIYIMGVVDSHGKKEEKK